VECKLSAISLKVSFQGNVLLSTTFVLKCFNIYLFTEPSKSIKKTVRSHLSSPSTSGRRPAHRVRGENKLPKNLTTSNQPLVLDLLGFFGGLRLGCPVARHKAPKLATVSRRVQVIV